MEPLCVVAEIMGSPGKSHSLLFIQNCFKCDYEHYTVLTVIMSITLLFCSATHE